MANISSLSLIFVILVSGLSLATCGLVEDANNALAPPDGDDDNGICSSMVEEQGYTCEEHLVTTQDGYVLSMQRIPLGLSMSSSPKNRPPVLLQHGVFVRLLRSGSFEFDLAGNPFIHFLKHECETPGIDCSNLSNSFTGPNCCINPSTTKLFFQQEPQSRATRNLIHLSQMIREGSIAMFDYKNNDENTKHYGQPTPPTYNMSGIPHDLPLFLSYGGADALSDVNDVKHLLQDLQGHNKDKLVLNFRDNYAHVDFILGHSAKQDVYDPLISFLKLHQ